jgi:large subunit ribosomal protein L13e
MTKGHNNVLPNAHFRKHWHSSVWCERGLVKCHFNQPGKKLRRRLTRQAKAQAIAPKPTGGAVRPVVHSQTFKYNTKVRAGRGFTLAELKAAGINPSFAKTVGICVDRRRKNRSVEGLQANVQRLNEYKAKLVVLPKSGQASEPVSQATGFILPIVQKQAAVETRAITAAEKKRNVYTEMRHLRADARLVGQRLKAYLAAQEEAKLNKK